MSEKSEKSEKSDSTAPNSAATPAPNPAPARVVIPNTTTRDAAIAGLIGFVVLGFMIYGIMSFMADSKRAQSNTLTGTILEKQFAPAPEEQISVGRAGLKTKRVDGEYLLKVRVPAEDRTFDVPVEKDTYQSKSVGDSLTFLRGSGGH